MCNVYSDMENVNSFTQVDFCDPKFHQKARKLRQYENCHKLVNNANNTISIITLITLWYPEVNPFCPFYPILTINSLFTNTIGLKTGQQIATDSAYSTEQRLFKSKILPQLKKFT